MSFQDRRYSGGGSWGTATLRPYFPRPTRAVKVLLVVNAIVFLVQLIFDNSRHETVMSASLGVTVAAWWQLWRYVTFQFLHADAGHILMNMLGLYMLGTPLEGLMGWRKFAGLYLSCGVVAGVAYAVIGAIAPEVGAGTPIIGASGGVFGILLACAVYIPAMRFIVVPIRWAAAIIFGLMILKALGGPTKDAMSDVAHLGGAIGAAFWIWALPRIQGAHPVGRLARGHWQRKMVKQQQEELALGAQVDRVLQKVKQEGIGSLSSKDKKTLQEATRRQQQRSGGPN